MASKRKIEERRLEQRREWDRKYQWVWAVCMIVVVVSAAALMGFFKQTPEQEARAAKIKFQELVTVLAGDNLVSKDYPQVLKSRLLQMVQLNQSGQLDLTPMTTDAPGNENPAVFACRCGNPREKPNILLFVGWFNHFSEQQKSSEFLVFFSVGLYHELVHLEKYPYLPEFPTEQQYIEEESRAYAKTSLDVVRPLRSKGFLVRDDFVEIDEVLRRNGDNSNSPGFQNYIRSFSPQVKKSVPVK